MKWHYTKDNDFPKDARSCLCDLGTKYEVLCYCENSETWYDSWLYEEKEYKNHIIRWISVSAIDKEASK